MRNIENFKTNKTEIRYSWIVVLVSFISLIYPPVTLSTSTQKHFIGETYNLMTKGENHKNEK